MFISTVRAHQLRLTASSCRLGDGQLSHRTKLCLLVTRLTLSGQHLMCLILSCSKPVPHIRWIEFDRGRRVYHCTVQDGRYAVASLQCVCLTDVHWWLGHVPSATSINRTSSPIHYRMQMSCTASDDRCSADICCVVIVVNERWFLIWLLITLKLGANLWCVAFSVLLHHVIMLNVRRCGYIRA